MNASIFLRRFVLTLAVAAVVERDHAAAGGHGCNGLCPHRLGPDFPTRVRVPYPDGSGVVPGSQQLAVG